MAMHRGDGVRVIRRADGDGVDVFAHLVEHLAEIVELLGFRELGGLLFEVLSSMSQMATMLPWLPAWSVSLSPLPPTPMQAMLSVPVTSRNLAHFRHTAADPDAGADRGTCLEELTS